MGGHFVGTGRVVLAKAGAASKVFSSACFSHLCAGCTFFFMAAPTGPDLPFVL